jgi:hypothetical protein
MCPSKQLGVALACQGEFCNNVVGTACCQIAVGGTHVVKYLLLVKGCKKHGVSFNWQSNNLNIIFIFLGNLEDSMQDIVPDINSFLL